MKVLCTGANGFIGQHVVKALREAGHETVTLDMPHYASMDFAVDITQPLPKVLGLDAVIHLAALSHPRQCDESPGKAFDVNVNGTSNVLRMALASGAKKVVFSSSAHVYDIPSLYLPADENHPLRLNNTYTTTKILGEQLCDLYWTNHGLSYTVLRLFNAYGPGQMPGYFIPDMVIRTRSGGIDLKGAHTTKDWVFVADVADAFVKAVTSDFVGPVNIGAGKETTLETIASRIAQIHKVSYRGEPSSKDTRMCADIGRAKRVLGWEPCTMLEEGLDAVCNLAKT